MALYKCCIIIIIIKLAGSTWGASANSLRSFALALCYSAAENCTLVWSRSAHTSQVDVQLNSTVRLVSGTLRSTPLPWLPVLSNIELPALRRKAATDKHDSWPIQSDILKPPLLPLSDPTIRQPGFDLPRQQWSLLNRFSTEQRHCGACRRKWRLTDTDLCPCGETQTKSHIVESSPLTKLNGSLSRLHSADEGWRCCFVADQLWFMTRIREEEEDGPNILVLGSLTPKIYGSMIRTPKGTSLHGMTRFVPSLVQIRCAVY